MAHDPLTRGGSSPAPLTRFSIVVLTYNRAALLHETLESILVQMEDDSELLVIDDGSTDATPELLESYGKRIRVIRHARAGSTAACRTAYRQSRGAWLIFVDSDDRLRAGALAALRAAADAHDDAAMVLGRVCTIHSDGRQFVSEHAAMSPHPLVNFRQFVCGRFRAVIAGGLIKRDLLGLFDSERFDAVHGADLAVLGAGLMRKVVQVEAITLDFRAHRGSLRDDVTSIDRSKLGIVDMLFDGAVLPAEAMRERGAFLGFIESERARAYYRAKWYSQAWRSFLRAVRASPRAILNQRNARRAVVSLGCDLLNFGEGPTHTPPGPRLTGHGRGLWKDSMAFLKGCAALRHPVIRLRVRPRTYLLCEPADGQHVLADNAVAYHKTGILRADHILAHGYIGLNSSQHRESRRAFPATFGRQTLIDAIPVAVEILERHIASWSGRPQVEIGLESQAIFVKLGGRIIFGCHDDPRMAEALVLIRDAHQLACRELRANYRWPGLVAPKWIPLRRRRRYKTALKKITLWLQQHIDQGHNVDGQDMLAGMRRAQPAELRSRAAVLRDPIFMIFLGSMEPVSITLALALERLADHPAIQDRVAAEAAAVLQQDTPTLEHLSRLAFTTQVVNETLRLHPNEWLMMRRAIADDRLPSGVRVRKGEEVMISPYLYGHDARFFPDPERFDPERFSRPPTWPKEAYIPFGAGPRSCLGEHLARHFLVLAVAMIVAKCRVSPHPGGRSVLESVNLFSNQPVDSRLILNVAPRVSMAV